MTPLGVSIGQALRVLQRVDTPTLQPSARQLRLWHRTLAIGAGKASSASNAAHLFGVVDLALARLIARLQQRGVSARVIWGVLTFYGSELRRALAVDADLVLWVEPTGYAHLLPPSDTAAKPRAQCYPLPELRRGIGEALTVVQYEDAAWCCVPLIAVAPVETLVS